MKVVNSCSVYRRQCRYLFVWLIQMLVVVTLIPSNGKFVLGQVATQEEPQAAAFVGSLDDLENMDLSVLSDAELESICTIRGFELYREINEDTGEEFEFSHEDYVEAAKQCLAVEQEMNEILAEHPELLEELQSEVQHMVSEKKRLEDEIATAQETVGNGATTEERHAFVHDGGKPAKQKENIPEGVEESQEEFVMREVVLDESEEGEKDENREGDDEGIRDSEAETGLQEQSSETDSEEEKDFMGEVIAEVKKDFKKNLEMMNKVADVVFPKQIRGPARKALVQVLNIAKQTGASTVDMLKRYLLALIHKANKKLEEVKAARDEQNDEVEPESKAPETLEEIIEEL